MCTFNSCSRNYWITSSSSELFYRVKRIPTGIQRVLFVSSQYKSFKFVTKRLLVKITFYLLTKISKKPGTSRESFCHMAREFSLPKKVKRFTDTMKNEFFGVNKRCTHKQVPIIFPDKRRTRHLSFV